MQLQPPGPTRSLWTDFPADADNIGYCLWIATWPPSTSPDAL